MTELFVIERENEGFLSGLRDRLAECGAEDVSATGFYLHGEPAAARADLVVISPMAGNDAPPPGTELTCRILLLPDSAEAEYVRSDCIVTYGMSAKSTITLSSIGEECDVFAILRELMTVKGEVLDRQELCICGEGSAETILAMTGTIILLGYKPKNARVDGLVEF